MTINTCPLQKDTCTLWNANDLRPMSMMEAGTYCVSMCYLNGSAAQFVLPTISSLVARSVQQWKAGNTHGAIINGVKATLLTAVVVTMTGVAYQTCSTAVSRIG